MNIDWPIRMVVLASLCACDTGSDAPSRVSLGQAEDVFVKAYCERMFSCRCEQGRYFESFESCAELVQIQVDQLRNVAGLDYDPSCLGALKDRLDDLGCDASAPASEESCVAQCQPFHGARGLGESCHEVDEGYSDCAQRLRCEIVNCDYDPVTGESTCTGMCVDPCAGSPDGPCNGGCDDDYWCDIETDACKRMPHAGDLCPQGFCGEPDYCAVDPDDPTVTRCFAPAALGEACSGHSQCASGYCPAGSCADLPKKGESCAGTFACAPGLDCDNDTMKCVTADALVCQLPPTISNGY